MINFNIQYQNILTTLRNSFLEDATSRSGIIGWAYDGNPIYGPYGYPDPAIPAGVKTIKIWIFLILQMLVDRPSGFDDGFFVEDYKFDGSGDLDEYNGRYEKMIDFQMESMYIMQQLMNFHIL